MKKNSKQINSYLNRKLDEWDWIKEASEQDVIEEIKYHYPGYNPNVKPFKHQNESILLGIINPQFNFHLDMGLGKTFVVLQLLNYYKCKCLVLVPNEVNVASWEIEINKFTNFKAIGVSGTSLQKEKLLQKDGDIYIANYMGFLRIFTKKGNGKDKSKSVIDFDKVKTLLSKFDAVIFDEIHKLGNSKSLITQLCDAISAPVRSL